MWFLCMAIKQRMADTYHVRVRNTFIVFSEQAEADFQRQSSCPAELESTTSLMIKNLPLDCSFEGLKQLLDAEGFQEAYDFLYLSCLSLSFLSFMRDLRHIYIGRRL